MGFRVYRGGTTWNRGDTRRFIFTGNGDLVSLDAETGKPDPLFGDAGRVDLRDDLGERRTSYFWTSPPVVCRGTLVVGNSTTDIALRKRAPKGTIRGYAVRTGELLWTFNIIPAEGEPGHDSWEDGSAHYAGHANVWTWMSCDEELGYVYAPTSTPNNDWYGGHRPGAGLYGESLLCLEARTGKLVWHFQAVHHGLWDYDFPAGPPWGRITAIDLDTGEHLWMVPNGPGPRDHPRIAHLDLPPLGARDHPGELVALALRD